MVLPKQVREYPDQAAGSTVLLTRALTRLVGLVEIRLEPVTVLLNRASLIGGEYPDQAALDTCSHTIGRIGRD